MKDYGLGTWAIIIIDGMIGLVGNLLTSNQLGSELEKVDASMVNDYTGHNIFDMIF